MGDEFYINQKKYNFKDVIEDFHKIHLIAADNCQYCERENIKDHKDKLELIKKITSKYFKT